MAEEQDYFGNISIPDDETEQDAANDVTFGDIGDVKAGDDISETLWKPNHFTFSSTIQAEKKKFLIDFDPQPQPPPQSQSHPPPQSPVDVHHPQSATPAHNPSQLQLPLGQSNNLTTAARNTVDSVPLSSPPSSALRTWPPQQVSPDLSTVPHNPLSSPTTTLQQPLPTQQLPQQPINRLPNAPSTPASQAPAVELPSVSQLATSPVSGAVQQQLQHITQLQLPNSSSQLQTQGQIQPPSQPQPQVQLPIPPQLQTQSQSQQPTQRAHPPYHLPQPQQSVFPSSFPFNKAMSLDDYERNMIALYDQQARDALTMHEDRVAKQLQKALIAQRAGVSFDRGQFDRHQEATRQFIITDFYARVQQIRMLVWQQRQQQQQHLLQQQQQQQTPQTQLRPLLPPQTRQPPSQQQAQQPFQVPPNFQQPFQQEVSGTAPKESIVNHEQPPTQIQQTHIQTDKTPLQQAQNQLPGENKSIVQEPDEKQKQAMLQALRQTNLQHQQQTQQDIQLKLQQLQQLQQVQQQQQLQQLLQQKSSNPARSPASNAEVDPQVQSQPKIKEYGATETEDNLTNQSFDLAASILAPLQDELDSDLPPIQINGFSSSSNESSSKKEISNGKKPKSNVGIYSKNRSLSNGMLENDPRMQEIERQMAKAGLGPSNNSNNNNNNNNSNSNSNSNNNSKRGGNRGRKKQFTPLFRSDTQRATAKKSDRRLESMTDRDQELVFRVHLRQIESSAVYKDDYYSTVLAKEKETDSQKPTFSELSEIVQTIRLSNKERGGEGSMRHGSKKSKRGKQSANGEAESNSDASPSNSDANNRPFANALGTVTSWNPRAPRRVMGSSGMELMSPESDEKTTMPMVDDVRVRMRRSIEDGYDIIATIHDICRGESSESLEKQMRSLIATLHLREENGSVSMHERESWHSTRFFEYMCVAEKGRRFLEHVIELLDLSEMVRLMPALFANLGSMIMSVRIQQVHNSVNGSSSAEIGKLLLSRRMLTVLRDAEVMAVDCLVMLQSFILNHALEHKTLICTLRSTVGARLVYTCFQRVAKGYMDEEVVAQEVERCHIVQFSDALTEVLPTVFKGAASDKGVWDVIGAIDGLLLNKESQRQYRICLSDMVRNGDIPSPPEV